MASRCRLASSLRAARFCALCALASALWALASALDAATGSVVLASTPCAALPGAVDWGRWGTVGRLRFLFAMSSLLRDGSGRESGGPARVRGRGPGPEETLQGAVWRGM